MAQQNPMKANDSKANDGKASKASQNKPSQSKESQSQSNPGQFKAGQIKPNTPVVCSNAGQFAIVDHMEGKDYIKLTKDAQGVHHFIPLAWVTKVDDKVHVDRTGDQAMREWLKKAPNGNGSAPTKRS